MNLAGTIMLFVANFVWRLTGARFAGRVLIRGLESSDNNCRLIAGMFVVKGGKRAEPLLREALAGDNVTPLLLQVAADTGLVGLKDPIAPFIGSPDEKLANAAKGALAALDASERLQPKNPR